MHITLETDYAIRIVNTLVKAQSEESAADGRGVAGRRSCLDAKTISERTEVPQRFALKILRKLVSGGIVRSYRGVYGGYELCAAPSEISVCDVVELVEGEYRFSRCLDREHGCTCEKPCSYRQVFGNVTEMVRDYLKQQTFDKLAK